MCASRAPRHQYRIYAYGARFGRNIQSYRVCGVIRVRRIMEWNPNLFCWPRLAPRDIIRLGKLRDKIDAQSAPALRAHSYFCETYKVIKLVRFPISSGIVSFNSPAVRDLQKNLCVLFLCCSSVICVVSLLLVCCLCVFLCCICVLLQFLCVFKCCLEWWFACCFECYCVVIIVTYSSVRSDSKPIEFGIGPINQLFRKILMNISQKHNKSTTQLLIYSTTQQLNKSTTIQHNTTLTTKHLTT